MKFSESINELAKAWVKVQNEVQDPIKNRKSHNGSYADLGQSLLIARPLLSKYGLALIQHPGKASPGKVLIESLLIHSESGEWVLMEYEMNDLSEGEKRNVNAAQATGLVITYARRYALTTLMLVSAQEDTDANISNPKRKVATGEVSNLLKACNNNKDKVEGVLKWANISNINELTLDQYLEALEIIKKQNGVN